MFNNKYHYDPNKSTIIVHVIVPSGTRFESLWYEDTPHKVILDNVSREKWIYGYNNHIEGVDSRGKPCLKEDRNSGFRYDNPNTIVAIGKNIDGEFVEVTRLKGPKTEIIEFVEQ